MPEQSQPVETSLRDNITAFREKYSWSNILEDRELVEMLFAIEYKMHFSHGTSGHLGYNTIYKLFLALTVDK